MCASSTSTSVQELQKYSPANTKAKAVLCLCLSNHYAMNTYGDEWLAYMHSRFTVKEKPSIRPPIG